MENKFTSPELLNTFPKTEEGVTAHDQSTATGELPEVALVDRSSPGLPASLSFAIDDLISIGPRKIGGTTVLLRFISSWAKETNAKYDYLRIQHDAMEGKMEVLSKECTELKIENAKLHAEAGARDKEWPVVTTLFIIGPIAVGIGLDQLKSENWGVGVTLLLIGVAAIGAAIKLSFNGGRS